MKKLVFVVIGVAAMGLGACSGGNQDQVQNAELNQPNADELNELSNQAAMDAANEAAALKAQQQQLNSENAAAADNTVNPKEAEEQNVSGM